jgi:hypothetical protein
MFFIVVYDAFQMKSSMNLSCKTSIAVNKTHKILKEDDIGMVIEVTILLINVGALSVV